MTNNNNDKIIPLNCAFQKEEACTVTFYKFFVVFQLFTDIRFFVPEIRYETAYACEGKVLKIECKDGELIKLIRANYGRFSITICNDHGNTDWSVNCMSPKSLRVLHSK